MSALARAILVATALAAAPARGRAEERPALQPIDRQELSELAADGDHKEKVWAAEYRERRRALLKSPAWEHLSRARRKAILGGLSAEFRARKTRWRDESRARELAIFGDSVRATMMSPSEKVGLWALRSRLQDQRSFLREDYAFQRAALAKGLESGPITEADKAAELDELERRRKDSEIRLDDAFWQGRLREAWLHDAVRMGGGHERDEWRFQEPVGKRAGAEDAQGTARLGTGG